MALVVIMFGFQALAQGRIDLGAKGTTTPEAQNVSMSGFIASFSYNSIESEQIATEKGTFSIITMDNTLPAGNVGEPQVLVTRKLIAVPFGATPKVEVKNYTVNEYKLSDFGIERLYPQQASVSKSQTDVKFEYNEKAYTAKGFDNRPIAEVTVMGTMRGIQIGALQLNSVRYDASSDVIRVYNDIEVEVTFENADMALTEQTLVNTYSPYFRTVYASLFNERAIRDIYDEHPDLWAVPVKVLVIANRMFEDAMQPWIQWKTEKGFYMDVNYTDQIGSTASAIKTFITDKYNEGLAAGQTPTWVIIVGDKDQVPASQTGSATHKVTDLYYYAVAGGATDYYGDMFHSRFTCETVQEFQNVINKSMMYEQYTMPDPSYLSNVLLVAGWDSSWNPSVGKPTIQYAMNYYYNQAHGFANVYNFLEQPYNNPYASLNTGVSFVNYTAHGGETGWSQPALSVSDVNSFTNSGKPFLAMGNCCLAADWGYSSKCFGEAMIIAPNKGAYAYIGSCPSTYWYEDYYFGVGATNTFNQMPTYENSSLGVYDATFRDDFNSVSAIPYIGNVAVCYAHANGYQGSVTDQYYWECYHVLGDGTVCPYHTNPIANTVSHMPTLPIGMNFFTVTADPGSYVGISKDGVLYGAGEIGVTGTADIQITPITSGGNAKIVVTHPQRQPYIMEVPCAAMTGPYIVVNSYEPHNVPCVDPQTMTVTFKNVGADATTGTTNVVISSTNENITITDATASFGPLAADATVTLTDEFAFTVAAGVPDNTNIQINYTATCGTESWDGIMNITVGAPIIEYAGMEYSGGFTPGETQTVTAVFHNAGHYQATNAVVTASTTSEYATIVNPTATVGTIGVDENGEATFEVAIDEACPESTPIVITFDLTADNEVTATGEGIVSNTCVVVFSLHDSWGDGWNGASLTVEFSDGSEPQSMTVASGNHEAEYTLEISIGTVVTVSFVSGSYNNECSFEIAYEGGDQIYASSGTPTAGQVCQFAVNCSSITYEITAVANPENAGTITGAGTLHEGSTCTLTAIPGSEYSFVNWTRGGEIVSTNPVYSFIVSEDADFVANFAPFQGVVIGEGTATDEKLPSYSYYKYGLSEQIYTADEIGMTGVITSLAFFNGGAEKTRQMDIYMVHTQKSEFSSGTDWIAVTAADQVFGGTVVMTAGEWTTLYLTTPFIYDGTNNLAIVVDDNSGDYTSSPHMACRVFSTTGSQAITIWNDNTNFDPTAPSGTGTLKEVKNQVRLEMTGMGDMRHITVAANPVAGGTVTGGGYYDLETSVTITATANTGYTFINWTCGNEVVSTNASYTFTVTEDADFIANFEINSYEITVAANNDDYGTVTGGGTFNHGESATIVATPNEGYVFVDWRKGNAVVSTNATYTFTVTEAGDYIANFEEYVPATYDVVVSAEPADFGTVDGGGTYTEGDECTVTAEPVGDAYFVNWTENGQVVSTEMEYTFTVTANRTLVAHFAVDGVEELTEMNVVLYPNPTSDKVMIETSEFISRCEVYNINGALVYSMNECSNNFEINVSEFAAGSYIVRLISDKSVQTRRFTKK